MAHSSRSRRRRHSAAAVLAKKRGLAPGTAVYTGEPRTSEVALRVMRYGEDLFDDKTVESVAECFPIPPTGITWINVDGLHDVATVQELASQFGIHALTVEDILNVSTPAKAEDLGSHIFVVLPMASLRPTDGPPDVDIEQISVLMGPRWVLTLQERPGDVFDALRARIRGGQGRARRHGADYLLHALLDAVVDGYFEVLHAFELEVLALEERAVQGTDADTPQHVHLLQGRLHDLRRRIWPLQAAVTALVRDPGDLFEARTTPFLGDLSDHVRQAVDIMDGARDRLSGAMQLHLAMASHRMNEVMRLLTVVATIFIPLTFVAGIYGMNFSWMPELQWEWGYPVALAVMVTLGAAMAAWFRHRRWF